MDEQATQVMEQVPPTTPPAPPATGAPGEPPKPPRRMPIWAIVAVLAAVALAAVGGSIWLLGKLGDADERLADTQRQLEDIEQQLSDLESDMPTDVDEPDGLDDTPAAEEPAAPAPAPVPKPSFESYAYVRSVSDSGGSYTVHIDRFDIYTGQDAIDYANAHGQVPPGNQILYVNESLAEESYPLTDDAALRAATGGVENLTMVAITPVQLMQWATGDWDAIPGAMTDMWRVTVKNGKITKIDMIAVAD